VGEAAASGAGAERRVSTGPRQARAARSSLRFSPCARVVAREHWAHVGLAQIDAALFALEGVPPERLTALRAGCQDDLLRLAVEKGHDRLLASTYANDAQSVC
jgi:hypothetical protein